MTVSGRVQGAGQGRAWRVDSPVARMKAEKVRE